jgi:hypothetical protein
MFFRFGQCVYAPLYALFWVGPVAMLIEMWLDSRRLNPVVNAANIGPASGLARH